LPFVPVGEQTDRSRAQEIVGPYEAWVGREKASRQISWCGVHEVWGRIGTMTSDVRAGPLLLCLRRAGDRWSFTDRRWICEGSLSSRFAFFYPQHFWFSEFCSNNDNV